MYFCRQQNVWKKISPFGLFISCSYFSLSCVPLGFVNIHFRIWQNQIHKSKTHKTLFLFVLILILATSSEVLNACLHLGHPVVKGKKCFYLCVLYEDMCMWAQTPKEVRRGTGSPGAEVTDAYTLLNVRARTQILVLCRSSECSQLQDCLLPRSPSFLMWLC